MRLSTQGAGTFAALTLVSALTLVACPEPKTPDPDNRVDAGDPDGGCEAACAHLRAMPCQEGTAPSCEYACGEAIGVLIPKTWPACVLRAESRADLTTCNVRCR